MGFSKKSLDTNDFELQLTT